MNHLYENIAYLKGLAEGLEIAESKNGKMVLAIIDVLDEMATAINSLNEDIDELDEYAATIDEDLEDLERDYFGDEEDYEDSIDLVCPECGELIYIDDEMLVDADLGDTDVICPVCEASINLAEYSLVDEEDACGCGCGCDETPVASAENSAQ